MYAAIAVAVVVVVTIAMAFTGAPSNQLNVPPAAKDVASPPEANITKSPAVPDFYNVTAAPAPPGTVVKSEPIAGSPAGVTTYRFIYHSRDNHDQDSLVSGMYALPSGPPPPGGYPLITLAHGTTGAGRPCGPSLTPFNANEPGYYTFHQQMLPLLEQGYAVVATDYQGMGAPGTPSYLVGQIEGQNVLDAVRAVHTNWSSTVNPDKTVIWGHSQGGHSSSFAAQLAPAYAPELQIQGAAVLAPGLLPALPLAVSGLLSSPDPSGMTSFVMDIAASWAQAYPGRIEPSDILTPAGVAAMQDVATLCGSELGQKFMAHPMSYYVKNPVPAVFYDLATENTPGSVRMPIPIWMVQGMKDTTIIPQLTLAYDKLLCNNGSTVDFQIYLNDDHSGVVANSQDSARNWIKSRFSGETAPDNCTNQ